MNTLHWNGEFWYEDRRPIWKRVQEWLCWIGGWGVYQHMRRLYPDHFGWRSLPDAVAPISLLGHRFTWFGWGCNLRVRDGWLVYVRPKGPEGKHYGPRLFFSTDGTPPQATVWFKGAPYKVRAAAARQSRMVDWREQEEVQR